MPSLLSSEDIDRKEVVDTVIGIVEDVAEKTGKDKASNITATEQDIMKNFEGVIESLEYGTPSLMDEILWFPSFRGFIE